MGKDLIKNLRNQQWEIWAEGDRLRYRHPGDVPQADVLEEIKRKKSEVLQALADEGNLRVISATPAQFALWFTYQLHPAAAGAHNTAYAWSLNAPIDRQCMQTALGQLLERHSCLRSTFSYEDEKLFQAIHPTVEAQADYVDARTWTAAEIKRYSKEYYQRPFDLTHPQLVRVLMIDCPDQKHQLMIVADHIAADGLSYTIIINELEKLYTAAVNKTSVQLPALTSTYSDFIYTQHTILNSAVGEKQKKYWQEQLADHHFALDLPTDHARPHDYSYQGASLFFELSVELTSQLKDIAQKTSLNTLLMAAFHVFLYRHTSQDDVLIGTPVPGRTHDSPWSQVVGYFVNMLIIRGKINGELPFSTFAQNIYRQFIEAIDNQDIPFINLVKDLQPERDTSRTSLFQSSFVLQKSMGADGITESVPADKLFWNQFCVSNIDIALTEGQTELSIEMVETQKSLHGYFKYNSDLFEAGTAERFVSHFMTLLKSIAANPDQAVDNLSILDEHERYLLLNEWNQTNRDYSRNTTIHELFEKQVEKTPDNVAVAFEDQSLTYRELNARANQLAHHLRTIGVMAETLVAIACERSFDMIIGILGILKAGGAYVPLDPVYPKDRLEYMLDDTNAAVLLTQSALKDQLPIGTKHTVVLDAMDALLATYPISNPLALSGAHNLAYVIYTSGSTGKPKGVMIENRSVLRLVINTDYIQITPLDRVGHASSTSFDAATFEIWGALLNGAELYIVPQHDVLEIQQWITLLEKSHISILFLTTRLFDQIALFNTSIFRSLKYLLVGGEKSNADIMGKVLNTGSPSCFMNVYGPTEMTTFSTAYPIKTFIENEDIPIGRPIANTQSYILDHTLRPVPIGVIGELYIGGDGLARGYLNRPELSAERFITNPFITVEDRAALRPTQLYRTGDLCRYLEDGNIQFLGRIDHQVKIRGFRIELGEIEAILLAHPSIQEAAILAPEDELGNKRLVAYFVPTDTSVDAAVLRDYLKATLPDYMVPSFFVPLKFMPLNPNGKLDRKALPEPERGEMRQAYAAPRTMLEQKLADVWQEILHLDKIGIHDNFFELGGDSILSIQVISKARQNGIHLKTRDIFQSPTIAALAEKLAKGTSATVLTIKDNQGDIPLLPIEHWFTTLQLANPHHFNQDHLLALSPNVNMDCLKEALKDVFTHHDVFRIRFSLSTRSQWYQPDFDYPVIETRDLSGAMHFDAAMNDYANKLQSSLNVETGPL